MPLDSTMLYFATILGFIAGVFGALEAILSDERLKKIQSVVYQHLTFNTKQGAGTARAVWTVAFVPTFLISAGLILWAVASNSEADQTTGRSAGDGLTWIGSGALAGALGSLALSSIVDRALGRSINYSTIGFTAISVVTAIYFVIWATAPVSPEFVAFIVGASLGAVITSLSTMSGPAISYFVALNRVKIFGRTAILFFIASQAVTLFFSVPKT